MKFTTFVLLFFTFPIWFPPVAAVFMFTGLAWVIGYGIYLAMCWAFGWKNKLEPRS